MPLVLAIEPDLRQATILKRIVRDKVHADVAVVESPDAAVTAIGARMPDVLLLSALLSPRDEDELIAHLRSLHGADHIQTHTIPQLASTAADQEQGGRKGLLGVFKRKKDAPQPVVAGCDPDMFAEEISTFLQAAADKKAEGVAARQSRADQLEYLVQSNALPETQATAAAPHATELAEPFTQTASEPGPEPQAPEPESSWSSPFEWKKKSPEPQRPEPRVPSPESFSPESSVPSPEPFIPESQVPSPESYVASAESVGYETPAPDVYVPSSASYVGTSEPTAADSIALEAVEPVSEVLAPEVQTGDSEIWTRDSARETGDSGPGTRDSPRRRNKVAAATLLRLTPLAMWTRTEATPVTAPRVETPEPQTAADELRHLMAHLGVPPHVAGVSYGRGCRIRRVRVPGGKERRRADAPGPVILSKRALDRQREANQ